MIKDILSYMPSFDTFIIIVIYSLCIKQLTNTILLYLKPKVWATDCDGTTTCSDSLWALTAKAWPQFIKAKIDLLESVTFYLYLAILGSFQRQDFVGMF